MANVPHISELSSGPVMPRTKKQMQLYMSGKHEDKFRGPITREERRWWNKYWTLKGSGFTKPIPRGQHFV